MQVDSAGYQAPVLIWDMTDLLTPYVFAIAVTCPQYGVFNKYRISSTSSTDNLRTFLGRNTFGFLCRLRPLAYMSSIFSWWVPSNRHDGLTHGGLSQRCNTSFSGSPLTKTKDSMWALTTVPLSQKVPYSFLVLPVHSQQPSVLSTLDQNLSRSSCVHV